MSISFMCDCLPTQKLKMSVCVTLLLVSFVTLSQTQCSCLSRVLLQNFQTPSFLIRSYQSQLILPGFVMILSCDPFSKSEECNLGNELQMLLNLLPLLPGVILLNSAFYNPATVYVHYNKQSISQVICN